MMGHFHTTQSISEMLGAARGTTAQGVSPGAGTDPALPNHTNVMLALALRYQIGTRYVITSQF